MDESTDGQNVNRWMKCQQMDEVSTAIAERNKINVEHLSGGSAVGVKVT
jgi:hypothetical protein